VLQAVRARLGPALSSFEVMWPSFYDYMTGALPSLRRPFAEPHGMYLLIEASGFDAGRERDVLQDCLAGLLEQGAVTDAVVAASDRDARDLWAVRDSPSEYSKVLGPLTAFDVGLPASVTGAVVDRLQQALTAAWPDIIALFYGHIGDSNLHIVTNVPSASVQPSGPITDMVYDAIGRAGGTISAEHGIGLLKRPYLALSRSPEELALMRRLKSALDPDRTLNAGKVLAS
jgi:FAD/FMN-containing dehydrogenase